MSADRHRYVSTDRRVREDRRFVVGKGQFVADIDLPNMRHVALVTCPYPAARIKTIDKSAALAMPGVHYVLDGRELAEATLPLMTGLDTPNVPRRPLATDVARYAGEWVAAVVADTRALAEDAAEKVRITYEKLPFVLDAELAIQAGAVLVHQAHGSNVLLDKTFVWGEVEQDFKDSPRHLSLRVKWGRSATVPIETFGVAASWDPWREMLDVYASIQMPRYADQISIALKIPVTSVRVHHDVDVGGSYGALLAAILTANPDLKGRVFDLPDLADASETYLEVAGVGDRAGDGGSGDHDRTHQDCPAGGGTLPALEVAVGGTGAELVADELVGIHREAHRAAGGAPLEAGLAQHLVDAEFFALGGDDL